ncbi:MAG TPA: FecR domain-containing protein [Pyrinomonadaceae bacterium]|nr:FecR domain-containing protein [Pyrinomonadaceae bacterium]
MFSNHVTEKLSAYRHAELSNDETRQVAEHLIGCTRCRLQLEEIKLGVKLAEALPQVSAPASLWSNIEAQLDTQPVAIESSTREATKSRRSTFKVWQPGFAGAAAGLLFVVCLTSFWIYTRESRPFWDVVRINGAPRIGSSSFGEKGQLAVGQWLETDESSSAKIDVATIGHVEIDPNTRVRLVETRPTEHRLELARGKMSAKIWAPPRLFFVDTPSAVAADLGCAYTLEVDDAGASLLHVTAGWVALQLKGRESVVPAGAACATRPGIGPGTPYFLDASPVFKTALTKLDFDPGDTEWPKSHALDLILQESRHRDTLTLWNLLYRVEGEDRVRVYERMAALAPPPKDVTREGVLRLDEPMLRLWKGYLENSWSSDSGLKKVWVDVWTKGLEKFKGLEGKK